jgi:hypothetical protein
LYKLKKFGINEKWFENYVLNRKQYVSFNNEKSIVKNVVTGVPQGSIIGPFLFILYANDISCNVNTGACNLYADDAIVYTCGSSLDETVRTLNKCMSDIENWYTSNRLSVNAAKSYKMLIRSYQKTLNISDFIINFKDNEINNTNSMKYLGLYIDPNLNWHEHVLVLVNELRCKLGLLRRIAKTVPKEILSKIYMVYLQPRIDYCLTIWGYSSEINIKNIQRIQNTAARIVLKEYDVTNTRSYDLLRRLNWMNVKQRRDFLMAKLMYKCVNGMAPNYLCDLFYLKSVLHPYETRYTVNENLYIPKFNTNKYKTCIMYQGPKIWNTLPKVVKNSENLREFVKEYRNSILF